MPNVATIQTIDELSEVDASAELVLVAPNSPNKAVLERLIDLYQERGEPEVLGRWKPFPEALKAARDGLVERGVDRRSIGTVEPPLVFVRDSLAEVMPTKTPVADLARAGARISVYDEEAP